MASVFEAGAGASEIALANLEVPIDILRGFLVAARGVPWLGAEGKEEVADRIGSIDGIKSDWERNWKYREVFLINGGNKLRVCE